MNFSLQPNQISTAYTSTPQSIARCMMVVALILPTIISGCSQKIDSHYEFVELAYHHERNGELPEAVVAYMKALELDQESASTWYDLGVAYAAMEQFPNAIDAYSKAIKLDSAMDRAFNNRAAAYAALNQLENALQDCNRAIELRPADFLSWRNRGLAHHDLGNKEQAIADYDESIRLNGQSAATYLYRGNAYLEKQAWQRSLEDFNHAVHLDDKLTAAWHSRAKVLAQLGRRTEAEESAATAKKLGADVSDVFTAEVMSESAPVASTDNQKEAAMAYVADLLKQQDVIAETSKAPWDLQGTAAHSSNRYIVRLVSSAASEVDVRFTNEELRQVSAADDLTAALIVLEPLTTTSTETGDTAFRVLKNIENWRPDFSAMKPLMWSLPVEKSSAED